MIVKILGTPKEIQKAISLGEKAGVVIIPNIGHDTK